MNPERTVPARPWAKPGLHPRADVGRPRNANLTLLKATAFYDADKPCGMAPNFARYLVAEAGSQI
jgi:hypothetical protein